MRDRVVGAGQGLGRLQQVETKRVRTKQRGATGTNGKEERKKEKKKIILKYFDQCERNIKQFFFFFHLLATVHSYLQLCTVAEKLKFLTLTPLLQLSFLCFGVAKIAIQLFSYTAANALRVKRKSRGPFQLLSVEVKLSERIKRAIQFWKIIYVLSNP